MAYLPCSVPPSSKPKKPEYKGYPQVECINGEKYYTYKGLVHTEKGYFKVTRRDEGESIFKDLLPLLLNEYNELLKPYEYPVIGTVDFYGNTIQYSSEEELEYIKEFSVRFDARTVPIFEYCHNNRGHNIPEVYNALTDIKNDELRKLNKHLKYKVDPSKVACIKFL